MKNEQQEQLTRRNDFGGNNDFNGEILKLSTRYSGIGDNRTSGGQQKKPSAESSLMLSDQLTATTDAAPVFVDLVTRKFEAETEEEVKAQVEAWAQEQTNSISQLLRDRFSTSSREKTASASY